MGNTAVNAIIQKIKADAERDGAERYAQIRDRIDSEAGREDAEYRRELEKRRDSLIKANEREFARGAERVASRVGIESLNYRHELVGEIFGAALAKLNGMTDAEFAGLLKGAVRGMTGTFGLHLGELSEGRLDEAAIGGAVKGNEGLSVTLKPEPIPGKNGFLLTDGRVEYSMLFEDLVEDLRRERAAWVFDEVFGPDGALEPDKGAAN